MGWMQVLAVALGFGLALALVRDFLAGLDKERIWSDPLLEETPLNDLIPQHGLAPVIPILKEESFDDTLTDQQHDDVRGRFA